MVYKVRFGNALQRLLHQKPAENMLDTCYLRIAVYWEVLGNDVTPKWVTCFLMENVRGEQYLDFGNCMKLPCL